VGIEAGFHLPAQVLPGTALLGEIYASTASDCRRENAMTA
jgi:hypothetical protein